ncbi:MAG TPA: iron uptake transporter deferrochelatase/peroxidase subunit [Solirubrobacterales bacterium]|nr:iron uptake transporter deferrochelatase/peroxidase subunit [Solirubrobacterales bacterium]
MAKGGGLTRRTLLGHAAALGVGAGLGYAGGELNGDNGSSESAASESERVEFYGPHQAGIATLAQEFLSFATFDLSTDSADDLRSLLLEWTAAAAAITQGKLYQPDPQRSHLPPDDPAESAGLGPQRLTLTFGFGPSLFGVGGEDRFGFGQRRPAKLSRLPVFSGDVLEDQRSDGDLCVQACAENPQVAFHAIHVLARAANGVATLRWSQDGFGRTSSTSREQPTPRNLMGFKDGTNNIRAEDSEALEEHVWVQPGDGADWMAGGTYLVARRIKMLFDVWDATSLEGQEAAIGRAKDSGAPLGQGGEFDNVDLGARTGGQPVIPEDAHVRLSSPESNGGKRILRRGYSFSEPSPPGSGEIDAGLFFISFQRSPEQFAAIQRRLSGLDALNRHLLNTASALFACPPGVKPGGFVGEGLFA